MFSCVVSLVLRRFGVDRVIYSVLGVGCPKEESWEEEEGKGSRWCES
jgi:hypothetical protein